MKRLRPRQRGVKRKLLRRQPGDGVASRMPRKRPPFYEVTDGWRDEVDAELARRKMTRVALAKELKIDKSSVTVLLRRFTDTPPGPRTSTTAKPVADFLRIPLPSQISEEAELALPHLRAIKVRNPEEYSRIIALLQTMSGLGPGKPR